jgi:hypothetical protein
MDPASIAQSGTNKQSSANPAKVRKRGRGRPPLSASLSSSSTILAASLNVEPHEVEEDKKNDDNGVESSSEFFEKRDETTSCQQLDADNFADNCGDNKCNESEVDTGEIEQVDHDNPLKSENRSVLIEPFHPLMGVWEGNFSVMTQKGIWIFPSRCSVLNF